MKRQFWNHTLLTRKNHIVLYVFTAKTLTSIFCDRFVLKTRALNQQNTQLNCTYIKPTPQGCSEKNTKFAHRQHVFLFAIGKDVYYILLNTHEELLDKYYYEDLRENLFCFVW